MFPRSQVKPALTSDVVSPLTPWSNVALTLPWPTV
jgi:hypothetical protein